MKGISFQKPLELNLKVAGETWQQGDPIQGELIVKNHGPDAVSPRELYLHLAYGELKKVRLKAADAFDVLNSAKFETSESLTPSKEVTFPWKFETDRNCPITDASGSLFLVYGHGAVSDKSANLQLPIQPYSLIQEFLKTIQTQFRFVFKSQKGSKGKVEVKLTPPSGKAFAMLDLLVMQFNFEGDTLRIQYQFQVKRIEASAASVDLKKERKKIEQNLSRVNSYLSSGRVNYEVLEGMIQEALSTVENKITF